MDGGGGPSWRHATDESEGRGGSRERGEGRPAAQHQRAEETRGAECQLRESFASGYWLG